MDGWIADGAVVALLLLVGSAVGLARPGAFSLRWLLAAAGLVLADSLLLTRVHHLIPNLVPGGHWAWEGKVLALAFTLAIAALPAFGWRRCGLTLRQNTDALPLAVAVAIAYCLVFVALALVFPSEPATGETLAFQLTLPGLEEEPFYRGLLLVVLGRAFMGRQRLLGVDWGVGDILSCALFGLAHAFDYAHGRFSFDLATMAMTAGPSFIAVWLRLRTGSVLIPILMHNFGNAIGLLI